MLSLQYALLAGAAVLIGCCRGQGPSPVVTDPTTEPATNTTIPSEEQAIIVVMALIGVAVIIIAISLSAAVIVIKNKPHKSNKTRPQVEEGQHQMTEVNGGMIEESISVASSDQMTPPAAPHTASHKHHHHKHHRHRHRQRERQQHQQQQQEGSPDQNEQEQDHDTQEEQDQQLCTVALDSDDTRQQQPLAVQQQHQPEPSDHDAAASKQDQYLSEDSDDNMDVIMEEPILEEEEDVDKAGFTRSYDIIEEMTGPRPANLDSAAAAAGLSSWVNIDGTALLEKFGQQQQQQRQESLLTSTSTVASSESGFVVVDPSLATALAQDKKDKKQLLLAKTMAGDRS